MDRELILKKLVSDLKLVDSVYDYIRLVDPVRKQTITYTKLNKGLEKTIYPSEESQSYMNFDTTFQEGVSALAIKEKRSIVKIESTNKKINLITAVPINHVGLWYAIEFIKDITNDAIIHVEGSELETKHLTRDHNDKIIKDAFKSVHNDRYIHSRLSTDIIKAHEENRKLALFIINISNIKQINKLFGSREVDNVLSGYSTIFDKYTKKPGDWVSRHGESAFLIVLYDVDSKRAHKLSKYFHEKLNKYEFPVQQANCKVQFSIGFHILDRTVSYTKELIHIVQESLLKYSNEQRDNETIPISEGFLPRFLLTAREFEVAMLMLSGKSNFEIAQSLFIGLSTAKKHISNIFRKTNVLTRSEFIAKYK